MAFLSKRKMCAVISTVGAFLLSACQTTTDPAQGGFVNGVSALSSGAYDQRIQARKGELSSLQQANARLEAINRDQNRSRAALRRQIGTAEQEYEQVNAEVSSLQARLTQLKAQGQQGAKINSTQSRLNSLQGQANSIGSTGSQAEAARLAKITAEIRALQSSLDAAFGAGVGL